MTENYSVKMLSGLPTQKGEKDYSYGFDSHSAAFGGAEMDSVDVAELIFSLAQAKVRVGLGVVA